VIYPGTTEQTGDADRAVDGLSKEQAFDARRVSEDLLFDISADPGQQRSVATDHPDGVQEARKAFVSYLEQIGTVENIVTRWRHD
jgi:hypothetical protein